jgi:hypothetical protein
MRTQIGNHMEIADVDGNNVFNNLLIEIGSERLGNIATIILYFVFPVAHICSYASFVWTLAFQTAVGTLNKHKRRFLSIYMYIYLFLCLFDDQLA